MALSVPCWVCYTENATEASLVDLSCSWDFW